MLVPSASTSHRNKIKDLCVCNISVVRGVFGLFSASSVHLGKIQVKLLLPISKEAPPASIFGQVWYDVLCVALALPLEIELETPGSPIPRLYLLISRLKYWCPPAGEPRGDCSACMCELSSAKCG